MSDLPPGRTPRFSIIVNVFNGAPYLRAALDSAIAQTFSDWELIFWDDQSTDGSAEILKDYPDPRIRYFRSSRHVSLADARNQAMAAAHGDWLAFLDQDDLWNPAKLQAQSDLIDAHDDPKLGIVYGRGLKFNRRGHVWEADHCHDHSRLPEGNIFNELVENSCFIVMSSAVLRRSAVKELGGVPAKYHFCPDYFLYLAIARKYRAACLQESCCWYRVHDDSLSVSKAAAIHLEAIEIIETFADDIPPALYRRRQRIHQTLIGVSQILGDHSLSGVKQIVRDGSLTYLLSRPLARTFRFVRRLSKSRPLLTSPSWNKP